MGRPAKPTAQKILDGDRKDRINRDEPRSPEGLPEAPEWLDGLGREAYARLALLLVEMKLGHQADAEALAVYAQNYSIWRQTSRAIADEGFLLHTPTTTKINPLFAPMNEAQRTMVRILSQMGLTPAARAALRVLPDEDDELLAFADRGPDA